MILLINTGGKGERLRPLTDNIPKPMISINGKPMLHHLVDWAKKNDFSKIVMMNGYRSEIIENYFGDGYEFGILIIHSTEPHHLGSGGAIKFAGKHLVEEEFAYISGDLLCDVDFKRMLDFHKKNNSEMTILVQNTAHPEDSDILTIDENGKIISFTSKHDKNKSGTLANAGLVIMNKKILSLMDKENFDFENYIYPKAVNNGMNLYGYHTQERIMDTGTHERLQEAVEVHKAITKNNKAVLIDRDGVLTIDPGYLHKKEDLKFYPGVVEGLSKLSESDYKIIIVTNQAGIGRGIYTEEHYKDFEKFIANELDRLSEGKIRIDGFYYCPHHPTKGVGEYLQKCMCRKPNPGMLLKAQVEHGLDLRSSFVIGDKRSDIKAGILVGCKTIGVKTGHGLHGGNEEVNISPNIIVKDFREAVDKILYYNF